MSPNQPKTPITSFRLSEETRGQLARLADHFQTSMTEAVRRSTEAMSQAAEVMRGMNSHYPVDAYTQALGAFRLAMKYEPGDVLPYDVCSAVDAAVIAAIPIIREEQHDDTLRDVVRRLEGFGVDPDVIEHFRALSLR